MKACHLPICGMALEPEEPSLDDAPNPELADFSRRLWVAGALSIALLVISMRAGMFGLHIVSPSASPWVQLALCATGAAMALSSGTVVLDALRLSAGKL